MRLHWIAAQHALASSSSSLLRGTARRSSVIPSVQSLRGISNTRSEQCTQVAAWSTFLPHTGRTLSWRLSEGSICLFFEMLVECGWDVTSPVMGGRTALSALVQSGSAVEMVPGAWHRSESRTAVESTTGYCTLSERWIYSQLRSFCRYPRGFSTRCSRTARRPKTVSHRTWRQLAKNVREGSR